MAALAAAYSNMDLGGLLAPADSALLGSEESFSFLPNTDPATFVEKFQNSSSVDNRCDSFNNVSVLVISI